MLGGRYSQALYDLQLNVLGRNKNNMARKHGEYGTPTYNSWRKMMQRCYSENCVQWVYYGGRGINVCARWHAYQNFKADMGRRPEGMTLDRIDTNKNYQPGNCRWATHTEQMQNKRTNVLLTLQGKTQCLTQWVRDTGIKRGTIEKRLELGWSHEKILTTPVRKLLNNRPETV